jgi:N-acetylglucosaminyl-diphospho-decaprenol L-rhamnosyltransferase
VWPAGVIAPSLLPMCALVDVVVVSYNSRDTLRPCLAPLQRAVGVHVIVVDNDSADGSLDTVEDLSVTCIQLDTNDGFSHGVNAGWRAGSAEFVLILNPDTRIEEASLWRLVERLAGDRTLGAAAPRLLRPDGTPDFSLRRFPRLRSTYAQALFLHRLFPTASWFDELVRDERVYEQEYEPEWVSGACVLVRRDALEQLGGLDEGFFLYSEDIDLCRRLRSSGYRILYDPAATCVHEGGASGDRAALLAVLVESRLRYAAKHFSRPAALLQRLGIALGAVTHVVVSRGGVRRRAGHLRALGSALRIRPSA